MCQICGYITVVSRIGSNTPFGASFQIKLSTKSQIGSFCYHHRPQAQWQDHLKYENLLLAHIKIKKKICVTMGIFSRLAILIVSVLRPSKSLAFIICSCRLNIGGHGEVGLGGM